MNLATLAIWVIALATIGAWIAVRRAHLPGNSQSPSVRIHALSGLHTKETSAAVSSLSIAEIAGGSTLVVFGVLLIARAKSFPELIESISRSLPWNLGQVLKPVPDPKRYPSFYVQNAYAGGAIFIAGGVYIVVSAILGWG